MGALDGAPVTSQGLGLILSAGSILQHIHLYPYYTKVTVTGFKLCDIVAYLHLFLIHHYM